MPNNGRDCIVAVIGHCCGYQWMLGQDVIVPEVHGYTAITHAAYILLALSLSVVTLQVVALNYFDNTVAVL